MENFQMQIENLITEQRRLEDLQQQFYQEEAFLEDYTAHLALRESWLDKLIENGQDFQMLRYLLTIEKEGLYQRALEFWRQEKIVRRDLEQLLLKKEWLETQLLAEQKEKLTLDVISLEQEVVSMREAAQELSSSLAAERVTFDEEVAAMAEARKAFQMESENIKQEMDAFRKERAEQRMQRKAFRQEKEAMSNEREDFQQEISQMGMLRKAYLTEKKGIEAKREAFLNEANNLKTLHMDLNLNQNMTSVTADQTGRETGQVLRQASTLDSESVWTCRDINGNCTCSRKKPYGQRKKGKIRLDLDTPLNTY